MSKLTLEEKRIRLAETEGWTCPHGWDGAWPHRLDLSTLANVAVIHGVPPGETYTVYGKWPNIHDNLKPVPDYFGDLNVIVAAVAALPPTWNSRGFQRILAEILNLGDPATDWEDDWTSHIRFAQASAAERAEALGRDLELWKEGE